MTHVRFATPAEAPILSALAERSKAHWGYDQALMQTWHDAGVFEIDPQDCAADCVGVSEDAGKIQGFYRLSGKAPEGKLSDLWVDPEAIGTGQGRLLLESAVVRARQLGFTALKIHADPNAEGFYVRMGAQRVGETEPSPTTGRVLPILSLPIVQ